MGDTAVVGIFGRSDDLADDGGLRRRVEELERRVAALEWALRSAGGQVASSSAPPEAGGPQGDPAGGAVSAEVRRLALQGNKIQAIKVLRDETGLDLRQCKDIVDRLAP